MTGTTLSFALLWRQARARLAELGPQPDSPGDRGEGPERLEERPGRGEGLYGRRRSRGRSRVTKKDRLGGGAWLRDRGALVSRQPKSAVSRKATFAVKGDGAYSVFKYQAGTDPRAAGPRRPSRRAGSTPRPPPWPTCSRRRRSRSRSTRTISRWTSTGSLRSRRPARQQDRLSRPADPQVQLLFVRWLRSTRIAFSRFWSWDSRPASRPRFRWACGSAGRRSRSC